MKKVLFLVTILGLVFLTAQAIRAQVTATLVGRVTDPSSAVIPATKITLVNTATNETRTVEVGESGEFTFVQLPPGSYTLTAEHEGFRKEVHSSIVLQVGQEARVDIILQVGSVSETVDVTASAPVVSSENAALGNVVDQKKVVELPLNGRGYLQLAFLQPNVFAPAQGSTIGFRGGMNIAGSNEVSNQYVLDGVDNNEEASNQPLQTPVLDAVQEFRVLTGTYNAEYGRQSGGQIVVTTKSGTNAFHGTAWDFYRNSVFDARNFFAPQKLSFIRNQYGATLGGPIRKDKTFFFLAWENQNRSDGVSALAEVPSVAFRNGDFSSLSTVLKNPFNNYAPFTNNQIPQSLWSTQGAGLLALYPQPNLNNPQNNIVSSVPGVYNSDQFSVRVDQQIGHKDNIFAVYEFLDSTEFYPLANPLCSARSVPGWGCDEYQRPQQAVLGWTHVLSPSLVNEARVGYSRFGFYRIQQDFQNNVVNALGIGGLPDAGHTPLNNGAPQLTVTGYVTIGGATNLPQGRHDNNYNYIENMTWIKGSHTLKFGADFEDILFNSFFTSSGRGAFAFQGTFTGNAVADLLLGIPYTATRDPGTPFHNNISKNLGTYIQDDWKVTPKLTINMGLRWEVDFPVEERSNKIASWNPTTNLLMDEQGYLWSVSNGQLASTPDPSIKGVAPYSTDWTRFTPRLGIAWRPWGGTKTVFRAGFGTFSNHQITGNGLTSLMRNIPYRLSTTAGPFATTTTPLPSLANAFVGSPSLTPPAIAGNFVPSYTNEWSFGFQHEIMKDTVLEVSYLGNESHKLPIAWNLNEAYPGTVGTVQSRRPYQPWGSLVGGFIDSIGNANFNSLQVRVERRLAAGLSFTGSYVWSKSIDEGGNISTSGTGSVSAQNARDLEAERGLSDFNVPQRFVISAVWDIPSPMQNRLLKALAGGWQLKGILTGQKGMPFTVTDGTDVANTGDTTERPNIIGDWHVANPSPTQWFNACTILATGKLSNCLPGESPAWQVEPAGTFGNAGRNILEGPGLLNFDAGLSRQFDVTERIKMQFRSEFFNVLNRANFYLPTATLSSSSFATITQAADQPFQGAQRQIQFALKVIF